MSGKCLSITALFLLILGCLIGVCVILLQEDSLEDGSVGVEEKSFKDLEPESPRGPLPHRHHTSTLESEDSDSNVEAKVNSFSKRNRNSSIIPLPKRVFTTMASLPISTLPMSLPTTNPSTTTSSTNFPVSWQNFKAQHNPNTPELDQEIEDVGNDWESTRLTDGLKLRLPHQLTSLEDLREPYPAFEEEYENENEDELPDDYDETDWNTSEINELIDLATQLYTTGFNASDFQGIVDVYNQIIQRGNETGFLNQLNKIYTEYTSKGDSSLDSVGIGRNAYESSFAAFAFMSFGVFLLNQIHKMVGTSFSDGSEGRELSHNTLEESPLSVLFNPPSSDIPEDRLVQRLGLGNSGKSQSRNFVESSGTKSSDYYNNMFRAMLNLVNAYTKDSQALECIWAIYCEDLDKTSSSEGLYGIAARINSIGLRIILDQIPAELTMNALLRSLLGWDALPCKKMFPQCQAGNRTKLITPVSQPENPKILSQLHLSGVSK